MTEFAGVEKLMYSRKQAAYALGLSVRSIDYLIADKSMTVRRHKGRVLIPTSEVKRWSRKDHHATKD